MSSKKEFSDLFDEDFEVTYEEDPGFTLNMDHDTRPLSQSNRYDSTYSGSVYGEEYYDDDEDEYDDRRYDRDRYEDRYDEEDEDGYAGRRERRRPSSSGRRRKSRGGVPLASPIKKGGKVISRISGALVRQLSALIILATCAYVIYTFWRASTPYGDVIEAIEQKTITQSLAAYFCVAAAFLLFEFISLLWTMTRVRVRDGRDSWKEDTGRGFLSFILVFVSSYTCFLFSGFLPDSPEILYGIKGGLDVYGSMHNVLLGLCAAGALSCLVRRYTIS